MGAPRQLHPTIGTPYHMQPHEMKKALRESDRITWAVYVKRDDGDGDIVGVFPADSGRMVWDKHENAEVALAFRLANACSADLHLTENEVSIMVPWEIGEEPPSVYDTWDEPEGEATITWDV